MPQEKHKQDLKQTHTKPNKTHKADLREISQESNKLGHFPVTKDRTSYDSIQFLSTVLILLMILVVEGQNSLDTIKICRNLIDPMLIRSIILHKMVYSEIIVYIHKCRPPSFQKTTKELDKQFLKRQTSM